jgi:hypothetical protein
MPSQQVVIVTFQDPSGQPLAGGEVTFQLSVDISTSLAGGPQVSAGRLTRATLDSTGSAIVQLWPNDILSPAGSVYFVQAYTVLGEYAWSGQLIVLSSGSGVDFLLQETGAPNLFLLEDTVGAILLEN